MRFIKSFCMLMLFSLIMTDCGSVTATQTIIPPTGQRPTATVNEALALPTSIQTSTATRTTIPSPAIPPTITPTPTGAWISLSPDSGAPGTPVQIDGFLPGGFNPEDLKANDFKSHANVCWESCLNGLVIESMEVDWSTTEPGRFSLRFSAPATPWLTSNGPQPLKPGDYRVSLQCLGPDITGCALVESQPAATFHLKEPINNTCPNPSCSSLIANPPQGAPGAQIQIQGWSPLKQIIDNQAFGISLVLEPQRGAPSPAQRMYLGEVDQKLDGSLTATFLVPQRGPDQVPLDPGTYLLALDAGSFPGEKSGTEILLASTPFEITSAADWVKLPISSPLWIQPAVNLQNTTMAVDQLNPKRIAYCTSGAIRISQDGGQNWTSISTNPVARLAAASLYPLGPENPSQLPACSAVMLDSSNPESFYAVFQTISKEYGAPPIYFRGYFTRDNGKTWQLVPEPAPTSTTSATVGRFGWFWADGKTVQALYSGEPTSADQAPPPVIEQTIDGGASWNLASLICPQDGPCMRWGAGPGMISGMGAELPQMVMASQDNGQTWQSTGQSIETRAIGPHELVAFSPNRSLLISSDADYPLRYSEDGGKTWQALAIPPLPETNPANSAGYPGLQMLPDGSLLVMNLDTSIWWVLPPASQDWCATTITTKDQGPVLFQVAGDRFWWFTATSQQPQSAPASQFACQP
jgi:hypothetical protein